MIQASVFSGNGKRLPALVIALVCSLTSVAAAQTTERWSLGAGAGVSAVEKVGALTGGELAWRPNPRVAIVAEIIWFQNVVTRRQLDRATQIGDFLGQTQGTAASGSIEAPSTFAGGSLRVALSDGPGAVPYVFGGGGVARIVLQPSFSLAGGDVTLNLEHYGVTLGSDLTGESTSPATTAGGGVRVPRGRWYFDGHVRYTAIFTDDQTVGVFGAAAGLGVSF